MLVAALGLALLCLPKGDLHILLCNRHSHTRDLFYRYYTQIAEWFPYIVCLLLLLFGRIGSGVMASAAMAFSALTTQIFKHIVNAPRPVTWFAENMPDIQLPLVEGVRMNHWFSFPSGHTTSFFALAFVVSIIATKCLFAGQSETNTQTTLAAKKSITAVTQIVLFIAAALGGYSRIYLCQHFAADVLAGVVVGITITVICYAIFNRFENKKWYNYRIIGPKTPQNAKK